MQKSARFFHHKLNLELERQRCNCGNPRRAEQPKDKTLSSEPEKSTKDS